MIVILMILALWAQPNWASEAPLPEVFVEQVVPTPLFEELSYPARVDSLIQANIQAVSEGVITDLPVHIGSSVKKGQLLLRIKKNEPGFSYAPVKIVAPVEGIVSELKVTLGSEVSRGAVIAQITDPKKLKVQIEITAQDMKYIQPHLKGEMNLTSQNKKAAVVVKGVSPLLDPVTGTATAELSLSDNTGIQPGMLGFVSFKVNERRGFIVPENAIIYKGESPAIRVVENSVSKRRDVTLGAKNQGHVEVISGLQSGDEVVIRTSGYVADNEKVKVTESKE